MFVDDTKIGWIYSLKDSPDSIWGSVTEFYKDILRHRSNKKGIITFESKVWGKFHQKDFTPKKGDGIAFYHSRGAKFPPKDPYKRKQRISLIGKLNDIKYNGRKLNWINVSIEHRVIKILEDKPIVRDHDTNHIFENCGIVSGPPASLYKADKKEWKYARGTVRANVALLWGWMRVGNNY